MGDLDRLVNGQQLHVAQAAASLMRVSRRRRSEATADRMRMPASR
jgi:hypothetical protein